MPLDHIGLAVADFAKSKSFYSQALAPLGMEIVLEGEGWAMIGRGDQGDLWFGVYGEVPAPIHIAFVAETREQVDAFYRAALAAGGTDNGAPGVRAQYHPNYYGAFVLDLDGHNVEAVCHSVEAARRNTISP